MSIEGSYDVSRFAIDTEGEIQRLNAQIDLFWNQELALYQRLGLRDGMNVLDCGCGPGYLIAKLLALYPSLWCTGTEIDGQLVDIAKQTVGAQHVDRCSILQQSISAMSLPDDSFDLVIVRLVLEHLPEPMLALKEVLRVLRKGGKAIFVDNDFDLHERTWPDSPALSELYDAYRRARRSEGGNPCIGRQLPVLMKTAGYSSVDLHLLAAHNRVIGDVAFLKAEGAGIPAQLVKTGHLPSDSLDRIASQWRSMLTSQDHTIFRMLFAATGEKAEAPARNGAINGDHGNGVLSTREVAFHISEPHSPEEIRRFIQHTLAGDMNIAPESLAPGESLIHAGVDSMAAVTLCNRLESRLGISLTLAEVLGGSSIDDLARKIVSLITTNEHEKRVRGITRQPRVEQMESLTDCSRAP